jgi:hypothetical protein
MFIQCAVAESYENKFLLARIYGNIDSIFVTDLTPLTVFSGLKAQVFAIKIEQRNH